MQTALSPGIVGGAVAGLVLSLAAVLSLVLGRRQLGTALRYVGARLFSQVGFFSIVIVVFLVVSVLESGQFFNLDITHGAVFGLLGYALALGFDLVSVVCMQARLNALRMRDERGQHLNLIGVIICATVSAFANLCGSLQGYSPADLSHTPGWIQTVAPWAAMVFPAMIVILSMTTDHILDHAPARGIDVDTYREHEHKRVAILQVRLDTERALHTLEQELTTLRREREQAAGRERREWVFLRWLRPPVQPGPALSTPERDEITKALRTAVEESLTPLQVTLSTLLTQGRTGPSRTASEEQVASSLSTLHTSVDTPVALLNTQVDGLAMHEVPSGLAELDTSPEHHVHLDTSPTQQVQHPDAGQPGQWTALDTMNGLQVQQVDTGSHEVDRQDHLAVDDDQPVDREDGESKAMAKRVLKALQHPGVSVSDRQLAREIGCSPTTVARWKKRFQDQGLLPAT